MTTLQSLQSKVTIDTSDIPAQLQGVNQQIGQGLTQATAAAQTGLNQLGGSFDVLSRQEQLVEQQTIRTAQAHARALAAEGDRAGAVRVLTEAQSNARGISEATNYQLDAQIANLEKGASAAEGYGSALAGGLTSIVGPAAVAAAAIGAVVGVAGSFVEAFKFGAELESTTKSIEIQLRGVRDSGQAFAEAREYAEKYKLTQQETNEAMIASIPVIRNSQASLEDILGVFDRLQIRQPGKTFADAARALGELQAGQVVSIEHMFNVPANDANRMKKEIEDGGDAVQVLSQYLTDSGIGMDALKAKTEGATGAMKDLSRARENFEKAQADFAKGPGVAFTDFATDRLDEITAILSGDFSKVKERHDREAEAQAEYNDVIKQGKTDAEAYAAAQVILNDTRTAGAISQQELNELTGRSTAATQAATKAQSDYVDISKLTEQQQESLAKALESTADKASDAYAKLGQVTTDYQAKEQEAQATHNKKLQASQTELYDAWAKADQTATDARTKAAQDRTDKIAKATEDGNRRLADLEADYESDIAKKRADANVRYFAIADDLSLKLQDSRRESARRLTEIDQQDADASVAIAQAWADRQAQTQEKIASAVQDGAQKLASFEQSTLDARTSAQASYQQKVVDLAQRASDLVIQAQEAASRRADDLARSDARAAEDAADRAADQAEDRRTSDADRAQAHADRLAAIQERASGSGAQGRTTTLTGGRFTTELSGAAGGQDVASQIAAENAKYEAQLAAQQRSEQLQDSRAARDATKAQQRQQDDRARAEQDAAAKLAQQQQALQAQQAQLDTDYAQQQAKAQAAADRQRALLAQQTAEKIASIQASAAQTEAEATKADVQAAQHLQAQIAQERAAQAVREADSARDAARAQANLIAQTNRELAERQSSYEEQRVSAAAATARQIQDADTAYAKALVAATQRRTEDRAAATQARNERDADENAAYLKAEQDRATAYAKQKSDAEAAYAEQAIAYLEAQKNIGEITKTEAAKREALIQESYGRQAQNQRAAFDAAFGAQTGPAALGARQENLAGIKDAGLIGGGGGSPVSIGQIVLPGVQNAQQFLDELRGIVVSQVRSNGGDANKFWGGT